MTNPPSVSYLLHFGKAESALAAGKPAAARGHLEHLGLYQRTDLDHRRRALALTADILLAIGPEDVPHVNHMSTRNAAFVIGTVIEVQDSMRRRNQTMLGSVFGTKRRESHIATLEGWIELNQVSVTHFVPEEETEED